jgi:hypothetical protein
MSHITARLVSLVLGIATVGALLGGTATLASATVTTHAKVAPRALAAPAHWYGS